MPMRCLLTGPAHLSESNSKGKAWRQSNEHIVSGRRCIFFAGSILQFNSISDDSAVKIVKIAETVRLKNTKYHAGSYRAIDCFWYNLHPMRYYLIAGEASGDLHGSNLMYAILRYDETSAFRCWGGDLMEKAGGTVVKHYRDLAFMGFVEVLANLRTIIKNLKYCKEDIQAFQPDVLILIDYPGFNIRIAEWAKTQGIRVVYYISPQVWAWKAGRVKKLKRCVDRMITILPFEQDFYKKYQWEVEYAGHPLLEVVEKFTSEHGHLQRNGKTIALLPGSRKQEILKKLPVMLEVSRFFPEYTFTVAKAPSLPESFYNEIMKPYENVGVITGGTYHLLMQSSAALVTSGTATLETALFGVPQVICYKGNPVSYAIAKKLVNIRFIGLPNLILDRAVVKELIQDDFNVQLLKEALTGILTDETTRQQIKKDYQELYALLKQGGHASDNAAKMIMDVARVKK